MTLPELTKAILEKERQNGFEGQKGLRLAGKLPIPQDIANEFLKVLPTKDPRIKDPILLIMEGNRFAVSVAVEVLVFSKRVDLIFSFDPVVNCPEDPVFRLKLDTANVPDFVLDVVLGAVAKSSPFISINGREIALDLSGPFKKEGMDDLLPFIRTLKLTTVKRRMTAEFEFRVD
jgi:hypothetical protein